MLPAEVQVRGFAVNSLDGADYMPMGTGQLGLLEAAEALAVAASFPASAAPPACRAAGRDRTPGSPALRQVPLTAPAASVA